VSRPERYDRIGRGYAQRRQADPRIQTAIDAALGDARRVLNAGAGTGSYEPRDRSVVALEPAREMIRQRPPSSAPVLRARAEQLPFPDASFDAAMALLTVHHWRDALRGLRELRRVSRRQVIFHFDPDAQLDLWLTRDYLPPSAQAHTIHGPSIEQVAEAIGASRIERVPIPHDCRDGFLGAYWRRPYAYLDPAVRRSISALALLEPDQIEPWTTRLAEDLRTGAWYRRYADLLERPSLDLGYRLITS
jgi:SAM-dependent methyltransferase